MASLRTTPVLSLRGMIDLRRAGPSPRPGFVKLLTLVVVLALGAAACGSGEDGTGTGSGVGARCAARLEAEREQRGSHLARRGIAEAREASEGAPGGDLL